MPFDTTFCIALLASIVAIRYQFYAIATVLALASLHVAIPQSASGLQAKHRFLATQDRVFEAGKCSVCYDEYLGVEGAFRFPCGHRLCGECRLLKTVFTKPDVCPTCRWPLLFPDISRSELFRKANAGLWVFISIPTLALCTVDLMMSDGWKEILRHFLAIGMIAFGLYAMVKLGRNPGEPWWKSSMPRKEMGGVRVALHSIALAICLYAIHAKLTGVTVCTSQ